MNNIPFDQNKCADSSSDDWVQRTQLFRRWSAMKQEILLHKWYESEKAGYDVGWERAATSWMIRYGHGFSATCIQETSHQT